MKETGIGLAQEIRESSAAVCEQERRLAAPIAELVERLKRHEPRLAVTCARGSSAHAATFGKHLIERYLGIPVAAAAPNIASVYHRELRLDGQLFLAISQSGRSDDLVEMTAAARKAGALTVAIVNDAGSPLAAQCEAILPMCAGPELSVAATKTFVASLAALLRLTAAWTGDAAFGKSLERLPGRLAQASELDWSAASSALAGATSLVTIGRGPTLAIAREAALKLKETCNLHAEAFSGAEFLHGPVALVSQQYPIVMFAPTDEAAPGMLRLAAGLKEKGAALFTTSDSLPALPADHPETDAVCLVQTFYGMAAELAGQLGIDAARPRHLNKVTRTT